MNFEANYYQLWPTAPVIPDREPTVIPQTFDYESLKEYRLQSCPYIVVSTYDMVQEMIEDRFRETQAKHYQDWLTWIEQNV